MPEVSDLYLKICELFSSLLLKQISSSSEPTHLNTLVEKTFRSYILNHTQLIMQIYCETQEEIGKNIKELTD